MAFIMLSLSCSSVLVDGEWVACAAGTVRSTSMLVEACMAAPTAVAAAEAIGLTEPGNESEDEPCVAAAELPLERSANGVAN